MLAVLLSAVLGLGGTAASAMADAAPAAQHGPAGKGAHVRSVAGAREGNRAAPAPAAPAVVFTEDFQNTSSDVPVPLADYTGANGEQYTADPAWLSDCNGEILNYTMTALPANCAAGPAGMNNLRPMAYALGDLRGAADPTQNDALSAYTDTGNNIPVDPGAGKVQFQTVQPIDLPSGTGKHYILFGVDAGAVNCPDRPPLLRFNLVNGSDVTPVGADIDTCTDPRGRDIAVPSPAGGTTNVHTGTYTTSAALPFTGSSLSLQMINDQASGNGNDSAVDNISLMDATPTVSKSFSPTPVAVGGTSTLTFTVTNTTDLTAKPGWSFTDTLPAGLTVADPAATSTTCTNGTINTTSGTAGIDMAGDLDNGQTSCTFTVDVTSDTAGTYQNCASNASNLNGVNPPDCADVVFAVPRYTIAKTSDPADGGSAAPGSTVAYTLTLNNPGSVPAPASIDDDLTKVLDDADYNGDAASSSGAAPAYTSPHLTWSGTLAPGQTVTITYSVTVKDPDPGDEVMTNVVTGGDDSNCVDGTEAGCSDTVYVPHLTMKKSSDVSTALPGQQVNYTVTITNDGKGTYPDASFTDDLSKVLDDAAFGDDASASSGTVSYTEPVLSWSGDVAEGQTVTITYSVTVDKPDAGDGKLTNAIVGPGGSNCETGSSDPDCSDVVPVTELQVAKTSDAKSPVKPGDKITYTVTVQNPGTVPYTGASLSDDLTSDLDDAAYDGDGAATAGTVSYAAPVLSWNGDVPAGGTVTITYSLTVHNPDTGDKNLANAAVVPDSNCSAGSTDPACATDDGIAALRISKASNAPNPAKPGDKVTYTVTVENTGTADYPGASFTDDLSKVLDDAAYDGDASATAGTVSYAAPVLSWNGDVPAGDTVTITYSVTVNDPDKGDRALDNTVVGPPDSNCATGSKDPACSGDVPVADVQIRKHASPFRAKPGDKVTYTVTVRNVGTADYPGASFTDALSKVLDDAVYGDDASASSGTVSYTAPVLSWNGDVAAGDTVTITYSVTVNDPDEGDRVLDNTVVGPADSNCGPGSTDRACSGNVPVATMAITKTVKAPSPAKPGDKVAYTITVTNTGEATLLAAHFTDNLSGDLDDAAYDGDLAASTGRAVYRAPVVGWTGVLRPGASATITYSVTINNPDNGDKRLSNTVVGPDTSNCATGSDDPDCSTDVPVAQLRIAKRSVAPHPLKPGDKVTYTVTVRNTGTADYPAASFTDDLSKVLDDAAYDGDASASSGTVSYAAPVLSWNGDVPAGKTVRITYSVTVDDPDKGDLKLANAVVGLADSNCPAGSTDRRCATHHHVTPPAPPTPTPTPTPTPPGPTPTPPHGHDGGHGGHLPDTGVQGWTIAALLIAALAVATGFTFRTLTRRRRAG
ncbi:DUF7507 domain-containing protein [Streptomyces sp. CA-111067]|uniref:DUF7927 domain-containing protein n=1 Tax=Streptomyces sp. CA-111067 TaxID=3240046 RepID=UPI003D996666